ncbi:hypothetical protein DUI87_33175 [Hirundo rustica rustica]|uniref:Uncharacterized protein n=1 Tax=Hirundo rustica rustica TaxID=333673 RepID=A0A3M0INQ4_HIRRU|nr:hypothetical protein DUI87_33175 [Hirundo rustica rustica]
MVQIDLDGSTGPDRTHMDWPDPNGLTGQNGLTRKNGLTGHKWRDEIQMDRLGTNGLTTHKWTDRTNGLTRPKWTDRTQMD